MKRPSDARWLYLHFLDRELLMTCGLYGALSLHRVRDDFVMSLLSISEPAYVSTSVLFESDYAFELFRQYGALFSRQDPLAFDVACTSSMLSPEPLGSTIWRYGGRSTPGSGSTRTS